jgi:hypothetical protein
VVYERFFAYLWRELLILDSKVRQGIAGKFPLADHLVTPQVLERAGCIGVVEAKWKQV